MSATFVESKTIVRLALLTINQTNVLEQLFTQVVGLKARKEFARYIRFGWARIHTEKPPVNLQCGSSSKSKNAYQNLLDKSTLFFRGTR